MSGDKIITMTDGSVMKMDTFGDFKMCNNDGSPMATRNIDIAEPMFTPALLWSLALFSVMFAATVLWL